MQITTIGLDIAKNVFQVHGVDAEEKVVVRRQLRRGQVIRFFEELAPCLVGLEACALAARCCQSNSKPPARARDVTGPAYPVYVPIRIIWCAAHSARLCNSDSQAT